VVLLQNNQSGKEAKMDREFRRAVEQARRHQGLYFAGLLSEQTILSALGLAREVWQGWVYTPAVTVWVFLAQCLSADHSCREAVAGLLSWRLARGLRACSAETGAYCTARDRLPEETCQQLLRQTGRQLDEEAPREWRWHAHRVLDVDGSTFTMADTPENQAEYPQLDSQKRGCGFPIARIVVVFSLAVGTVLEAALGQYQGKKTGENSLFRTLHPLLETDDVVLADRYFSGWFDLALILQRGAHVVVRQHQRRTSDFRMGQRLGAYDHVVSWLKPPRPSWMSMEQYAALPNYLLVREVRVLVQQKGFRTQRLVVVTTLLDAEYEAEELAQLYRRRWQAELHLRSLKSVMQMDHLRCKTPHRVRNELYMHLIMYNLLRRVVALAAFSAGVEPWQVSFKGALQTLTKFLPLLETNIDTAVWCAALLAACAAHEVGHRPDRFEPRVVKRRPKPHKRMTMPRSEYKRRAA
jgi:putative transposase